MVFLLILLILSGVATGEIVSSVETSPQTIACSDSKAVLDGRKVASVCSGDVCLYIGYRQESADNQDPVLIRFNGDTQAWCRQDIETTGDDGFGVGLLWDSTKTFFYGAFTSKGTQTGNRYQDYTAGGWIPNFFGTVADSNNVKVSVILRIALTDGSPDKGTFVGSRLSNNKANTCVIKEMAMASGDAVALSFTSFYSPVDRPGNSKSNSFTMSCTGSSPLPFYIKFKGDLSTALEICGSPASDSGGECTPGANTCPAGRLTGVINGTIGDGGSNPGGGGSASQWTPLWALIVASLLLIISF